ncbi:hypothetical protein CTI12_AA459560 [Artemisia annua]|uniref:HAT C-terminal dimerisation domain-containing protein n=1 Tax=Artemisia annua TaxID=35608 RepID=A0A2U1LSK3_ARTAN|nr:hypothetical protein CTI12_AA459560 [Artemisia annua]
MSLILRYVNVAPTCVTVEESFLGFLRVDDMTGQGLFDVTHDELKSIYLDIDDVCGQGYDNGSNMKGKHRGESRVESVKAIRFQLLEITEALLQVAENDNDSKIKSESKSLATNELGDFEFLASTVIWFDILSVVNLLRLFNNYLPYENLGPSDILNFLKEHDIFPNVMIAYRVLLTIPITLALAEISLSKLKFLKSYLRSTMS